MGGRWKKWEEPEYWWMMGLFVGWLLISPVLVTQWYDFLANVALGVVGGSIVVLSQWKLIKYARWK